MRYKGFSTDTFAFALFFLTMKSKTMIDKGAVVSCLASMLKPSKEIRDRFMNMPKDKRLENLIVVDERVT